MKERRARQGARIGLYWFCRIGLSCVRAIGRIDRSVTGDHVEVWLRQGDHNALADPTHSAGDGRQP